MSSGKLQQFAFKSATNKNTKPIAGLCPAIGFVVGLLEHGCNLTFPNKSETLPRKQSFANTTFEPNPTLFNAIEIWRIGREIQQTCLVLKLSSPSVKFYIVFNQITQEINRPPVIVRAERNMILYTERIDD